MVVYKIRASLNFHIQRKCHYYAETFRWNHEI